MHRRDLGVYIGDLPPKGLVDISTQNHLGNSKTDCGDQKSPREPKIRLWEPKLILGNKDAREGKVGIWELETPNPHFGDLEGLEMDRINAL